MKKIISMVLAASLFAASIFANAIAVGARGSFNVGVSAADDEVTVDFKGSNGFGMGAYVNVGLLKFGSLGLGLQPEVIFNSGNGITTTSSYVNGVAKTTSSLHTDTLDVPLLLTLDIPLTGSFILGAGVGPMVSFPLKADYTTSGSLSLGDFNWGGKTSVSDVSDIKGNINFGVALDVNAKFAVAKIFRIVADVRYYLDITETQLTVTSKGVSTTMDAFTRRTVNIGAGIEIAL